MFNNLKIKIRTSLLSLQRKKKPTEFVNPYPSRLPPMNEKLNPFISSYATKKNKSFEEILHDHIKEKQREEFLYEPLVPAFPVASPIKETSFTDDMKTLFVLDIMTVAKKFGVPKKKEYHMSSTEILKACENTKWQ
jgi:hypothetical protein